MNVIKELWHGNIVLQEDSRTNTKEMKELLGYIARHHEDLDKTFNAEQKELYEKLHLITIKYKGRKHNGLYLQIWRHLEIVSKNY